jgi:hypothetical protein
MDALLAFIISHERPYMLRHAVLQMLSQTVPVDVAVFAAGDSIQAITDLPALFRARDSRLITMTGENVSVHANSMRILEFAEQEGRRTGREYRIFAKIDDDDLYFARYIEDAAAHMKTGVNVSSCAAARVINNGTQAGIANLGSFSALDEARFGMPPTFVFDARALRVVRDRAKRAESTYLNAPACDRYWREWWLEDGMEARLRDSDQFWYHVHGGNMSTGHFYQGG